MKFTREILKRGSSLTLPLWGRRIIAGPRESQFARAQFEEHSIPR